MPTVGPELERLHPGHRGKIERGVKMREQSAGARPLPFQLGPEPTRIDGEQHEFGLAGEMLRQSAFELMGGGEVDEAVSQIVGRALKMPVAPRPFVGGFGQHFVDRLGHGSVWTLARRGEGATGKAHAPPAAASRSSSAWH